MNSEYKTMVENKFNMRLEDIMHDICVVQNMVPTEAADYLGVPKSIFLSWRNQLRLGPIQLLADQGKARRKKQRVQLEEQLRDTDLIRPFIYVGEPTLAGLKELIERELELCKAQKLTMALDSKDPSFILSNMTYDLRLMSLESMLEFLNDYVDGKQHKKYMTEVEMFRQLVTSMKEASSIDARQ